MCIIRQLINEHSIIDTYPTFVIDKVPNEQTTGMISPHDDSRTELLFTNDDDDHHHHHHDDDEIGKKNDDQVDDRSNGESVRRRAPGTDFISEKIAQDVLVFKRIAGLMPPQSLLHLLRVDVMVTVAPQNPTPEIVVDSNNNNHNNSNKDVQGKDPTSSTVTYVDVVPTVAPVGAIDVPQEEDRQYVEGTAPEPRLAPYRATKVRFACNRDGKLLRVVHPIDRIDDGHYYYYYYHHQPFEVRRSDC